MGMMQTLRGAWVLKALIVVAFALRAVVPAGYMLASAGNGATVVLCSAQGSINVQIDPATGHVSVIKKAPGQTPDRDEPPCAFVALAKVAINAAALPMATPVDHSMPFVTPAKDLAPGLGLSAPPPPATGPPTSIA